MKPYLLLLAISYCYVCNATAFLTKVSIDERTQKSQVIIEGKVVNQQSFWNADKSSIFTVNTVEVDSRLKGSAAATLEIITPGGEIDGKLLVVEPNAELKIGSTGVFFLTENTIPLHSSSGVKKYEIYALAQGFIERDEMTGKYQDFFEEYQNKSSLFSLVQKTTGISYRYGNDYTSSDVSSATISSISPSTVSAGTQSVVTITGNGFGAKSGPATVQFRNANSTSSGAYVSIPDSTYIVSWTNTEIKVIVPGASAFGQAGAGTGFINVIDATGASVTSTAALTVTYNQFEYKKRKLSLINQNGTGGYTFTLNTDFNNNMDAKDAFTRALDQWKCKTGVNFSISNTTTANACSNQLDNINTITFASSSCALPAGALGITYSTYAVCTGSVIPDGIDMLISPTANFYYGTGQTGSNQYDFETVVLHELGHAFGQGHNSQNTEVMYPTVSNGASKRTLGTQSDVANINNILDRSTAAATCAYQKHVRITTTCAPQTITYPIIAEFVSDKKTGCAPLTVKFTDNSTGTPTAWRWDIDNNNTTDYTTQHPIHTFSTPGTYNVKLVAIGSNGKDSVMKTAQIIVAPAINLTMDVVQNVSCNGGNNGSLKATPSGGSGSYSYVWNNSQTSQTSSNLSAGTYSVTLKDSYNCSVTKSGVISQPEPLSLNVSTQQNGDAYSATLNVNGGVAPYSYVLNNTTPFTTPSISSLNAGNYNVRVQDKNNCIENATFSIAAPTALIDAERSFDNLNIYPNPATNNVNINFTLKEYNTVHLELFSLSGQTIFQDDYSNIKDHQASLDLSTLSAGTYILKFGLPEGNTFRKITVNR